MFFLKSKSKKTNLLMGIIFAVGLLFSSITFDNNTSYYGYQNPIESKVSVVIKDFTVLQVEIGGKCNCGKVVFLGITLWDGAKH